jgi:F1F0 ATPase subunit 2
MTEAPAALALSVAAGAALGGLYFASLWLVVRRLGRLARPALWLGVTSIVRLALLLGLATLLVGPRWERVIAALIGFVAVRLVLVRRLGRPGALAPRRDPSVSGGAA